MSNPDEQYRKRLIDRYTSGQATEDEIKAFFSLIARGDIDGELEDDMDREIQHLRYEDTHPAKGATNKFRWLAAASVILCIAAGLYFAFKGGEIQSTQMAAHDFSPGGSRATLTLADGSKILLDHAAQGEIASESGVQIKKDAEGRLTYELKQAPTEPSKVGPVYHTIETPMGGQFEVLLPDGTKVWLNAGSSLRFPAAFSSESRTVEMTGEAYFEVATQLKSGQSAPGRSAAERVPFIVKTNKQTIEVLGTQFNVNAYADEPVEKTTLLEGSVLLNAIGGAGPALLKPGQQAVLSASRMRVDEASLSQALAWKNGSFVFDGQDFSAVMRQISRWYGVDVVYENAPANLRIGGDVSRSNKLSVVLQAMELTGKVKFRIEDRRVVVTQ